MEIENEVTIATHNGSQVARQHNLRNPKFICKEDHIDPNGHFEVWLDEDPKAGAFCGAPAYLYSLPLRTFCNFPHKLSYKPHIMACEQFWEVMIWLT